MITCEECGCLVDPDPEMLQKHSDWHDDLVTKSELNRTSVCNPNRVTWETRVQDC